MKQHPPFYPPEPVEAEHTMFIMYTSGTTSKSAPIGIKHSTAGYLLYVALTHQVCILCSLPVYVAVNVCHSQTVI